MGCYAPELSLLVNSQTPLLHCLSESHPGQLTCSLHQCLPERASDSLELSATVPVAKASAFHPSAYRGSVGTWMMLACAIAYSQRAKSAPCNVTNGACGPIGSVFNYGRYSHLSLTICQGFVAESEIRLPGFGGSTFTSTNGGHLASDSFNRFFQE